MSKKGQTNRQVAEVIFGKAEATKILSTSLTKSELSDAEFTEEDKADDVSIKSFVDNFFDRTTVVIIVKGNFPSFIKKTDINEIRKLK